MRWWVIQWAGNGCILLGSWLLAKKRRSCLVAYSIGNFCWISYGVAAHIWPMVALDAILTGLNVWGWLRWNQ